jgi:hypothetical protein
MNLCYNDNAEVPANYLVLGWFLQANNNAFIGGLYLFNHWHGTNLPR